jgi:hypothetical protein
MAQPDDEYEADFEEVEPSTTHVKLPKKNAHRHFRLSIDVHAFKDFQGPLRKLSVSFSYTAFGPVASIRTNPVEVH